MEFNEYDSNVLRPDGDSAYFSAYTSSLWRYLLPRNDEYGKMYCAK